MFTVFSPFGKLNFKAAMLVPILLMSMFAVFPAVSQVAPAISKISPALFGEMANAGESINVLIKTVSAEYSGVVEQINDLGGRVGTLFKYVNGLSASLPASGIIELSRNSLVEKMYYDAPRPLATSPGESLTRDLVTETETEGEDFETIAFTDDTLESMPDNYWNTVYTGATSIWAGTNMGSGSLVVVIDTGIWANHFMFKPKAGLGEMAGGIDLSPEANNPTWSGWNMSTNHWHGSHTAGTIASRGGIIVTPAQTRLYNYYANSLEMYSGIRLPPGPTPGSKIIWTLGMAPAASLYIVKVFTHTGAGVSESYIIGGMEHALDLKLNQGYDVDVISMSIGGGSLFDGRDFEDKLVDLITANGITLVASAGNDGPASMTVGSPGSAYTTITVGAAEDPVHSKSFFDYSYQSLGIGNLMFTSPTPVMADYSSRGPTADGRLKPTLSATGSFVLSARPPSTGGLTWGSGTSMACPAVSGATALLNAYAEMNGIGATPEDYRQALVSGAVWLPGFSQYEQGAGYLNAANAFTAFKADASYGDVATPLPEDGQLMDIRNIPIVTEGVYTTSVSNLKPEHRAEFVFQVTEATDSIKVDVTNIVLGTNPLGINSLGLYIQSAQRTYEDYYINSALMIGSSSFYITDDATTFSGLFLQNQPPVTMSKVIEPGYVKVVLMTFYQSFDAASADITITVTKAKKTTPTLAFKGLVREGEQVVWGVPVPAGTTKAIVELWWTHGWTTYPTTDLDLIIYVNGAYNFAGATSNAPERVVINAPTGTMYFIIDGYAMYIGREPFELRITFV